MSYHCARPPFDLWSATRQAKGTQLARLAVVQDPPKTAKEALGATEEKFLHCRDLRHPWSVVGAPFYAFDSLGRREIHRKLVCDRCKTEATDRWSPRTAARIARVYKYAKGYSVKGVKIKPVDVRKEVLSRIATYANEDDMVAGMFTGRRKRA